MSKKWSKTEENLLKELVGTVPASTLALLFSTTVGAVRYRMKKMGLKNYQTGEYHWNARLTNLQTGMVGALYDAGYTPKEIHWFLTTPVEVSYNHVQGIAQCRERISSVA